MKQHPENEKIPQPAQSEVGHHTLSEKQDEITEASILEAFTEELQKKDSALYCEQAVENGRIIGGFIKRYKNPQDPDRKPLPDDEVVHFENTEAMSKMIEDNEMLSSLLGDYRHTKDTQPGN